MERKHAYLVLCHNNFEQVIVLLQLLDYEFNDIYIHVDKKAKQFPVQMIKKSVKKSKLFFIKRINVNWGAYSQIRAEIALLKAATKRTYVYYHLVSGSCLPLHSQSYIHYFFKNNNGSEFLRAENISDENNKYLNYTWIIHAHPELHLQMVVHDQTAAKLSTCIVLRREKGTLLPWGFRFSLNGVSLKLSRCTG